MFIWFTPRQFGQPVAERPAHFLRGEAGVRCVRLVARQMRAAAKPVRGAPRRPRCTPDPLLLQRGRHDLRHDLHGAHGLGSSPPVSRQLMRANQALSIPFFKPVAAPTVTVAMNDPHGHIETALRR